MVFLARTGANVDGRKRCFETQDTAVPRSSGSYEDFEGAIAAVLQNG